MAPTSVVRSVVTDYAKYAKVISKFEQARIVGKSPANSRQILSRAHAHMDEGRRRFEVSRAEREEVAQRFIEAWETGDTDRLVAVLAPDATVYGDGGGKAPAIREPLVGALRVAKVVHE